MLITLRLTPTEAKALEASMTIGHHKSRSAAVRAGLDLLFDSLKLKREAILQIERERQKHVPRRTPQRRATTTEAKQS